MTHRSVRQRIRIGALLSIFAMSVILAGQLNAQDTRAKIEGTGSGEFSRGPEIIASSGDRLLDNHCCHRPSDRNGPFAVLYNYFLVFYDGLIPEI